MVAAIKRPGWIAGALGALLGAAFGFGLVVALRAISGLPIFQTEQTGYPQVIVPLITGPLGFLAGFGCFDYWLRWAAGMPTIPEDHSQHGATSWKDYFHFNTDHKVIGIQYIVHHLLLLLRRRPDGDADPRRAGPAGHPDRRRRRPTTASSRPTRC